MEDENLKSKLKLRTLKQTPLDFKKPLEHQNSNSRKMIGNVRKIISLPHAPIQKTTQKIDSLTQKDLQAQTQDGS